MTKPHTSETGLTKCIKASSRNCSTELCRRMPVAVCRPSLEDVEGYRLNRLGASVEAAHYV